MKKKFSLVIFIFFYQLFSFNSFAEIECVQFFNKLKNDYKKYEPNFYPRWEFNDFGFELKKKWNEKENTWEYFKDQKGYYHVGRITNPNLVGKIYDGDLVLSANGNDLRKLKLDNYENIFADNFTDEETVNVNFKRENESFSLILQKTKRDLIEPFSDFYIISLALDETQKKVQARINIEAAHSIGEDDQIYMLAKETLWFDENDEFKETQACEYDAKVWDESYFANPMGGMEFENLHSINYDTFSNGIFLKPYTDEIDWHKDNNWENELYVEYFEDGIHNFNIDFKYHNFPFDKQTISFEIVNGHDMSDGLLQVSDYSKLYLIDFQTKNSIPGWNIVDNRIKYGTKKNPTSIEPSATVSLEIDIERESGYYLYKVILPIIIILIVCWTSLWIIPKELEAKLTITIVCLLSLIAYNFIIDGEIPKLEYLTIIDWIILTSYFYAALPNILGIYFFTLFSNKQTKKLKKYETFARKYGLVSYLIIVFAIIIFNVNLNPENASAMFSWVSAK